MHLNEYISCLCIVKLVFMKRIVYIHYFACMYVHMNAWMDLSVEQESVLVMFW
jgi:hypothetical protein